MVEHYISSFLGEQLRHFDQAKLVKSALHAALGRLKEAVDGGLQSKLQRRLAVCLPYLADCIAGLLIESDNAELQDEACSLMGCCMEDLPAVSIHTRLGTLM